MASNQLTGFVPAAALDLFAPLRALEDVFRDSGLDTFLPTAQAAGIRMDVEESEQAYEVLADMPGTKKEDIKVSIDGRQVSLSAQSEQSTQQEQDGLLWRERHVGQWYRSFTLPQEVDEAQAQARYEDGVLHLTLPKKPGAGGTRLTIQ